MINTNLISTIQATKAIVNEMKHNGYGTIVITSSLASFCGIYGLSVYSATKFALRGFAEALSMEVSKHYVWKHRKWYLFNFHILFILINTLRQRTMG